MVPFETRGAFTPWYTLIVWYQLEMCPGVTPLFAYNLESKYAKVFDRRVTQVHHGAKPYHAPPCFFSMETSGLAPDAKSKLAKSLFSLDSEDGIVAVVLVVVVVAVAAAAAAEVVTDVGIDLGVGVGVVVVGVVVVVDLGCGSVGLVVV